MSTMPFLPSAEIDELRRELAAANARADSAESKLNDPHVLHAHCVRNLTANQVAHLFGERMTEVVNERDALAAQVRDYQRTLSSRREMKFVDASPDSDLPIRILSAYIEDGFTSTEPAGLGELMNQWQEERNAILRSAIDGLSVKGPIANPSTRLFADDHAGMRYSIEGMIVRAAQYLSHDGEHASGIGCMLVDEVLKHLRELAVRYYSGDITVVDEFLQLYALGETEREVALIRNQAPVANLRDETLVDEIATIIQTGHVDQKTSHEIAAQIVARKEIV